MRVAIITAGGAGMYCGSCMHDNTWARALRDNGIETILVPLYTPIRVDETDLSLNRVFYGGINLYLNQKYSWWQKLPKFMKSWLDSPWVINRATGFGVDNDAAELGELTISMLQGTSTDQRQAGEELSRFLAAEFQPDYVIFSNVFLSGSVATIQERTKAPVLCVLQGDDVFLDGLSQPFRSQAWSIVQQNARKFAGFLTHSQFYRDKMSRLLAVAPDLFQILPLAIDSKPHVGIPRKAAGRKRIGYLARIAPEKGLAEFAEAARLLGERRTDIDFCAAGYLAPRHQQYLDLAVRKAAALGERFQYVGSPASLTKKVDFLSSLDLFSVPAIYDECKGLYLLEAMANGVPVVQPSIGVFPELLASCRGGNISEAGNPRDMAKQWELLIEEDERRLSLAQTGQSHVREFHSLAALAAATQRALSNVSN